MTKEHVERALLLDFDGVLLSRQGHIYWEMQKAMGLPHRRSPYEQFCPVALSNLSLIIQHIPNLKVVFSTSWRCSILRGEPDADPVKVLGEDLVKAGLRIHPRTFEDVFHSYTPVDEYPRRGQEIESWLRKYDCGSYVILDDIADLGPRHVYCDDDVGLDFKTMLKVFKMFGVETPVTWVW